MARRHLRLLRVLRPAARGTGPGDVHESQLSPDRSGRGGPELPGLGFAARPALPGAQTMVPDQGTGCGCPAGPFAARPRACTMDVAERSVDSGLESPESGGAPDTVRAPRAGRSDG